MSNKNGALVGGSQWESDRYVPINTRNLHNPQTGITGIEGEESATPVQPRTAENIPSDSPGSFGLFSAIGGRVYFMQIPGGGLIKIGYSEDPAKRKSQIEYDLKKKYGVGVNLEILATIPGDRGLESVFHAKFRKFRCEGEWFSPAPVVLELIGEIKASTIGQPSFRDLWIASYRTPAAVSA